MKPYYYVYRWNDKGPKVRHATLEAAQAEAMNERPTPETNALASEHRGAVIWPDFARRLERERDAERALADRLAEVLDYYYSEDSRHHIASNRAYARAAWNALAAWKEARSEKC